MYIHLYTILFFLLLLLLLLFSTTTFSLNLLTIKNPPTYLPTYLHLNLNLYATAWIRRTTNFLTLPYLTLLYAQSSLSPSLPLSLLLSITKIVAGVN